MKAIEPPVQERRDLRGLLRSHTAIEHAAIDRQFGQLNLLSRHGFATFLFAHQFAWSALSEIWVEFVRSELNATAPDYRSMLAADLDDMGMQRRDAIGASLPSVAGLNPVGVTYVLAGSRMGIGIIRRAPNWASAHARSSRYLDDVEGRDIFKRLIDYLRSAPADEGGVADMVHSAKQGFALFRQSLLLAQMIVPK